MTSAVHYLTSLAEKAKVRVKEEQNKTNVSIMVKFILNENIIKNGKYSHYFTKR